MMKRLVGAVIAVVLMVGMAGCGSAAPEGSDRPGRAEATTSSRAALRAYVNAVKGKAETEAMSRFKDAYSDFSLETEGDSTVVFRYTYRNPVDKAQGNRQIQSQEETFKTFAHEQLFKEMESAGVKSPAAKWIYQNPDGSHVGTVEVRD